MRMRPEHRMRTRRSMPGLPHSPGTAAAIAKPQPIARIEASAARVRTGNLAERLGTADFNNVHFAEGIRTVAIYRPSFLGEKYIPRHQGELLAGDADQD